MPRFRLPRISTRQELLFWFVSAAVGYQMMQSLLPSQRIDLAQNLAPEPTAEGVVRLYAIQVPPRAQPQPPRSGCSVPAGGGPALNAAFEPC